ncbi:MAG: PA14 domain-containing protein [Verrucomicrobiota bacterium]|nr:PA14 domain-containing protein [Verrucomicrobiota bacterium]
MHRINRSQFLCVVGLMVFGLLLPAQAANDEKLIAEGKVLFQTKICFTCHQVDESVPAPAGIAMKAPKFMGGFWGKKRAVTLGYGGKEATVTFDEAYFAESIRQPMDKVAKEAAAPMPPPPAVNDAEMRALIAYVRSLSEGDSAEDPSGLIAKGKINNFSFAAYKGNWDRLPDFSKLKPFKTGTAKTGTADPGLAGVGENFGVVFEGNIEIARKGDYSFNLGSDDGSRLYINGKLVVDNDGVHSMRAVKGSIALEPGDAKLRLEYFERGGEERLALDMSGPGIKRLQLAKQTIQPPRRGPAFPTGNPITVIDEARIYRNFIEGASPRGIGVGYPEKVNLCFDANTMQIAMLWHGAFMDAARHWNGRGQGFQRPSGHYLIQLTRDQPFAQLDADDAAWPRADGRDSRAKGLTFRGYSLMPKHRRPIFDYQIGNSLRVADYAEPVASELPSINRQLKIRGNGEVWYLAAAADSITEEEGGYKIGGSLLSVSFPELEAKPMIRESGGRQELLIRLNVKDQETLKQRYEWKL